MPIGAADVRPKLKWPIHEASEEQRVERQPNGEDCQGERHVRFSRQNRAKPRSISCARFVVQIAAPHTKRKNDMA
jgi:hypothetical protein